VSEQTAVPPPAEAAPEAPRSEGFLAARRRRFAAKSRRERGVVLIWFALMLIVLMGFAGFAVDLSNWWLQAERLQRAADSGAHAGVIYLPADLAGATSTARAEVAKNGYRTSGSGANASITVSQEPNPNRLRVGLTTTVDTFFVRLLGVEDVTLTRQAVAEYVSPVPMGSPQNKLGNDPDGLDGGTQLWVGAAGPRTGKQQGERYGTKVCEKTEFGCSSGSSDEFSSEGYTYAVKVKSVPNGEPLRIQIYDATYVNQAPACDTPYPPSPDNQLRARYPDANTVYASTAGRCAGDTGWGARNVETTYTVAAPDETKWTDNDNPVLNTTACRPQTAKDYNPGNSDQIRNWLLSTGDGRPSNDGIINIAEGYRRWFTICEIPANQVKVGEYILRVRTSTKSSNPTAYDASVTTEGYNSFSIRAGFGDSGLHGRSGAAVSVFAKGRLPIFANSKGADTRFYLARILPYDAGRTLRINLYDMGESSHSGTLRILAPVDYGGTFSGCKISRDDGAGLSVDSSLCQLSGVHSDSFNGRVLTIDVPIPTTYTCSVNSEEGCWVKIQARYPSSATVTDATTWSAQILGNPIRLVE
jgi:Flp pilus assembly protein TadG